MFISVSHTRSALWVACRPLTRTFENDFAHFFPFSKQTVERQREQEQAEERGKLPQHKKKDVTRARYKPLTLGFE